ncbi:MAG: leucyl/phenylalanyl-tRNA--protein transferase [Gemmataceae bacterium]
MAIPEVWRRLVTVCRRLWGTTRTLLPRTGRNRDVPRFLFPADPPVFPDPELADEEGLLAIGGDLAVDRLLAAYGAGIFPWYSDDTPILWWSPDPRGIFELDGLHVSRRLARTVRSGRFRFTRDEAFTDVMAGCAEREEGTWITADMLAAYTELHHRGYAHSVEVWQGEVLVGGIYGVTVGGLFAGESMFSRVADASKAALTHLVAHLRDRGYTLFDIQHVNPHTASLGAVEVSRREYLRRLRSAVRQPVTFSDPTSP